MSKERSVTYASGLDGKACWRWTQSPANPSPSGFRCLQGKYREIVELRRQPRETTRKSTGTFRCLQPNSLFSRTGNSQTRSRETVRIAGKEAGLPTLQVRVHSGRSHSSLPGPKTRESIERVFQFVRVLVSGCDVEKGRRKPILLLKGLGREFDAVGTAQSMIRGCSSGYDKPVAAEFWCKRGTLAPLLKDRLGKACARSAYWNAPFLLKTTAIPAW